MSKNLFIMMLGVLLLSACAGNRGHNKPHWSYSGDTGPEKWGQLSTDYELCGKGRNQSPIDLTNLTEAKLPAI